MSRDEAWFERLYERNQPMLRAYCARRVGGDAAQDAVSQVFVVAWRRRDDVPAEERELPWLYGVARRVLSHHWRSKARSGRLARKAQALGVDVSPGPEIVAAASAEHALVRRALAGLRPADREVLMLSAWEGLTHAEIAAVVGCSLVAADKRVSRAKARLTEQYHSIAGAAAPIEPSGGSLVRVRKGGGAG